MGKIMSERLQLLEKLVNANGASGFERDIRLMMKDEFEKLGVEISYDNIGSIVGTKVGKEGGPVIAIPGHMDEIGLLVTKITDEGFLKFQPIGGWWPHVMLSQQFNVVTREGKLIRAVTGSKPPHILKGEERSRVLDINDLYLDMGVKSKEEAEQIGVRVGDQVIPAIEFQVMANPDLLLAKAFDNRVGCAIAIEVLKELQGQKHDNVVCGIGTVQEEVGLRGARTVAQMIKPDVVFALDVTIATDMPGLNNTCKLGEGPAILLKDGALLGHRGLREFVVDICEKHNIPYQIDYLASGGTDAGAMHLVHSGAPAMSLCIPSRYIHSHTSMISKSDYENAIKLLTEVIKALDEEAYQKIKEA